MKDCPLMNYYRDEVLQGQENVATNNYQVSHLGNEPAL